MRILRQRIYTELNDRKVQGKAMIDDLKERLKSSSSREDAKNIIKEFKKKFQ